MTLLYIFAHNSKLVLPQRASLAGVGSHLGKKKKTLWSRTQGQSQGKSLGGGAKEPGGPGGRAPVGVQEAESFGGGQGAKPPEAEAFLVLKS